jgi:hypothetical protein
MNGFDFSSVSIPPKKIIHVHQLHTPFMEFFHFSLEVYSFDVKTISDVYLKGCDVELAVKQEE